MATARINGKMISWALRRSGATLESLVTPKTPLARIKAWELGAEFPSEGDAKALADRLGIAYPMLYIRKVPPDKPITIPDRRTIDGKPIRRPSMNLLALLDKTKARQEWYRQELPSPTKTLGFVARFDLRSSPTAVADHMRTTLDIDASIRANATNFEDFLKALIARAERAGILVMRSALVGHSTRRVLSVEEFRGFVLIDPVAPIIFINDNDAKAAQIFTFAHELAHIWIGESGISDRSPDDKGNSLNDVEVLCDKIAAEFLVPERDFRRFWSGASHSLDNKMQAASRHFGVSTLVILRRAKDLNQITSQDFFKKVEEQYEAYKQHEAQKKKKEDKEKRKGGNFWASFELRNGAKFNAAVADSVRKQRITYAEAGSLFWITPASAARYMERLSASR